MLRPAVDEPVHGGPDVLALVCRPLWSRASAKLPSRRAWRRSRSPTGCEREWPGDRGGRHGCGGRRRDGQSAVAWRTRRSPQRTRAGPDRSPGTPNDGVPARALRPVRNGGQRVRPAVSRGSSWAVPDCPWIHSVAPALGGDLAALVLRVQVLNVQALHLVGPCGGLVEHRPLRLLAQGDVQAAHSGGPPASVSPTSRPRSGTASTAMRCAMSLHPEQADRAAR